MLADPSERPDWFWELAVAMNAAVKGLLGSMGESGHICATTKPVPGDIDTSAGWPAALAQLVGLIPNDVCNGDVIVVADKVVAAGLARVGPRQVLEDPDPKTISAAELPALAERWTTTLGFQVTPLHLLMADEYGDQHCTLGTDDPNTRAAEIAAAVHRQFGVTVDAIISDTDTGLDTRSPIIGMVTFGATPIGATAGVNLYEAMRCAVAAEFVRGHGRRIPTVICRPADRRATRPGIGEPRSYTGCLNLTHEKAVAHA